MGWIGRAASRRGECPSPAAGLLCSDRMGNHGTERRQVQDLCLGTSFSGMHAVALAASDIRVAGGIAQCPLVDGLAGSRMVRPSRSAALFAAAIADRVGALFGRRPLHVPSLVAPGQWGMFDTRDAIYGQKLLAPREPADWHNRIAARSSLGIPFHRPIRHAGDAKVPLLLIVADQDTQAPVKPALTVAKRARQAELRRSRGGHFDVYEGERRLMKPSSGRSNSFGVIACRNPIYKADHARL